MPELDPGVTVPPTEPAANPAPTEPITPTAPVNPQPGSEPVQTPAGTPEQTVPFSRFQEVNDAKKAAEDELEQLRQQQPPAPVITEDDELDPDVEELIRKGAKKLGLVSQTELAAERMKIQVDQDVKALEGKYASTDVPYDHKQVMQYAQINNMPITSKASLESAYRSMNWDVLMERERQRAIDSAGSSPNGSGAERPGGGGPTPPAEEPVAGRNPRERGMSRIRAARQKLAS